MKQSKQRLSRCLLITADRAHHTTFKMSHEYLADMLGSTRSSVSLSAGVLKQEGLIDYTRGLVKILDVPGLEERSCECYRIIKDHLDSYTEFDSAIVE